MRIPLLALSLVACTPTAPTPQGGQSPANPSPTTPTNMDTPPPPPPQVMRVAPSITFIAPNRDLSINAPLAVQVLATGDTVELLDNGVAFTTFTAPPYSFDWDPSEGVHSLTARASTPGFPVAETSPLIITVDKTPPHLIASTPSNGATNVYLKDPLTLTFDEPLYGQLTDSAVWVKQDNSLVGRLTTIDETRTTLTFEIDESALLYLPSDLTVGVDGLTDYAGNETHVSIKLNVPSFQEPEQRALDNDKPNYAGRTAIAVALNETPYLVFQELVAAESKIFVKKWTGTTWEQLGGSLCSGSCYYPSIAIKIDGTPVVTYLDNGNTSYVRTKYWNGTTWSLYGTGFEIAGGEPRMALQNDTPVVTWLARPGAVDNIYVSRWTGSAWASLGGTLSVQTSVPANVPRIVVDHQARITVAWSESGVRVKRWNDISNAWELLGTTASTGTLGDLAFDSASQPVVAVMQSYNVSGVGDRSDIQLVRFSSSAWQTWGPRAKIVDAANANAPSISISQNVPTLAWNEIIGATYASRIAQLLSGSWQSHGPLAGPTDQVHEPVATHSFGRQLWVSMKIDNDVRVVRKNKKY